MNRTPAFAVAATLASAWLAACDAPDLRSGPYADHSKAVTADDRAAIGSNGTSGAPVNARPSRAETAAPPAARPALLPTEAISDSAITTRIKAAILSDPGLTGADISVDTNRGVVSLAGTVKSQEQAALASAHAQRQDGVMRVDNRISPFPVS